MNGSERVHHGGEERHRDQAGEHEQDVTTTLLRRGHGAAARVRGHEDRPRARRTEGAGAVAVRPSERAEPVVEVAHRVGAALLPTSPQDRRCEHRDPEDDENQDDRNRQGKRPRCTARTPNVTGCFPVVEDPATRPPASRPHAP